MKFALSCIQNVTVVTLSPYESALNSANMLHIETLNTHLFKICKIYAEEQKYPGHLVFLFTGGELVH
jgi:hypothetical protein